MCCPGIVAHREARENIGAEKLSLMSVLRYLHFEILNDIAKIINVLPNNTDRKKVISHQTKDLFGICLQFDSTFFCIYGVI